MEANPPPSDRHPPRRATVLDLMAVVAACSILFAGHHALSVALGPGPEGHLPRIATGFLLIAAVGHAFLTVLKRKHHWKGMDDARGFIITMTVAIGLPAAFFSCYASITAGISYLAATAIIVGFSMTHR